MADMTKKQRVRAALAGRPVDHVPVSLWGHDFLREWSPAELAEATLEAYRAYDWDFIKLNPRATYFAEAWGNAYERPREQHQPRLIAAAVSSAAQFAELRPVDPGDGVFAQHLEALRLVLRAVRDDADVVFTIFSPLGVAAELAGGVPRFLDAALEDRAAVHAGLAVITRSLADLASAALGAGAAGVFFAPLTWASHDTCSTEFYRELGRPYDLQVLHHARAAEFNILHVCRNHNMLPMLLDYPVAAFNWADHGPGNLSLAEAKERTKKAVMGGVDQARLHLMNPREALQQAREALAVGADRLFLTGGCAIRPETPAENRRALVEAARG